MRSSTSNSDIHLTKRFIPGGRWLAPLLVSSVFGLLAVVGEEVWLAQRGFVPTIVDSPSIWARERARASDLGADALILVGASRMQLDVDLDTMRSATGRAPVQLAIDGSSFVPVLEDLANDPRVTGTVLVDYQDHVVNDLQLKDGAATYLTQWERVRGRTSLPDFAASEAWLEDILHRHMRSFADGASPFASLTLRALDPNATAQYLVTLPDRERRADYTKVAMPQFYYARVMRNAGIADVPPEPTWEALDSELAARIRSMGISDMRHFDDNAKIIATYVQRIQARGGTVVFAVFPRSGLVRETDERMFPRSRYWDTFIRTVGVQGLHYRDVPAMAALRCPDGSHLDERDQVAFTRALVESIPILRADKQASSSRVTGMAGVTGISQEQFR